MYILVLCRPITIKFHLNDTMLMFRKNQFLKSEMCKLKNKFNAQRTIFVILMKWDALKIIYIFFPFEYVRKTLTEDILP